LNPCQSTKDSKNWKPPGFEAPICQIENLDDSPSYQSQSRKSQVGVTGPSHILRNLSVIPTKNLKPLERNNKRKKKSNNLRDEKNRQPLFGQSGPVKTFAP